MADKKRYVLWGIVLLWMMIIFNFSGQPAHVSNNVSLDVAAKLINTVPSTKTLSQQQKTHITQKINHYVRKSAHGIIYFVLAIFVMLAISTHYKTWQQRWSWAIFIGISYAITDEIHQLFVIGRGCQVKDIIIDSVGVMSGIFISTLIIKGLDNFKKKFYKDS
ncbi:MAG: VanZ family protein [Cellulosilyticaceae bacterium]